MSLPRAAAVALALSACDPPPDPGCDGDAPLRLFEPAAPTEGYGVVMAGGGVYHHLAAADVGRVLHVAASCRASAPEVARGLVLYPARLALDPADDDPALACGEDGRFYRLDLRGESPPTLLAPHLSCWALPTADGPLIGAHPEGGAGPVRRYPAFPDEDGAELVVDARIFAVTLRGDRLYVEQADDIHVIDLRRGDDERLVGPVDTWEVGDTHLLWHERAGDAPAKVHLLDLTTRVEVDLGEVSTPDSDERWTFTPDRAHVVRLASGPTVQGAADLAGRPRPFPAPGTLERLLADGAALSRTDDGRLHHTPIGAAASTALDVVGLPLSGLQVLPGRLEHVVEGDLVAVPFTGAPAEVRARDVGPQRRWLDDEHLLTLAGGRLTTVHVPSGARTVHAAGVARLAELAADVDPLVVGAFYVVEAGRGDPRSGVWHLPPSQLRPPP